jgi:competence protein ComEA
MAELFSDRRRVLVAACAMVALFVFGGRLLSHSKRANIPPPLHVPRSAASAKAKLVFIDVVGAVRRPGLYRLPEGSRVADALRRAGGVTRKAQIELVNLAALVADGEQVVVPRRGAGAVVAAGNGAGAPSGPVHLNSATLEQLDELPGVGPVTAQKIVDYRTAHGGFGSVDELDAVPGIGPARLADLRDLVAP